MKYFLLLLFTTLALLLSVDASAQKTVTTQGENHAAAVPNRAGSFNDHQRPGPGERIDRLVKRLTERLYLNETQQAQVRAIAERYAAKRKELRETGDKETRRNLRKEQNAELQAVLNAEQQAEYIKMKAERRKQGRGDRGKRGDRMIKQLTERLDLSELQQAQIRAIADSYTLKRKELREAGDKEALHKLRKEQDADFQGVLTTEQQAEYKKLKAERREQARERRKEKGSRRGNGGRG